MKKGFKSFTQSSIPSVFVAYLPEVGNPLMKQAHDIEAAREALAKERSRITAMEAALRVDIERNYSLDECRGAQLRAEHDIVLDLRAVVSLAGR